VAVLLFDRSVRIVTPEDDHTRIDLHLDQFFSFSSSGHHRDLHSFPTRRSSDLHLLLQPTSPLRKTDILNSMSAILGIISDTHGRSEEHTSELQSLAYLVCRLLLEKKNDAVGLDVVGAHDHVHLMRVVVRHVDRV